MKFTNKHVIALMALMSSPLAVFADKGNKTVVVNCGDEALDCSGVINAIGDPMIIDTQAIGITDLGIIKGAADEKQEIVVPATEGSRTVYSLTPTAGESANEKINIVFDNIEQRPGTRLYGKTLIRVYRRFAKEADPAPWIEVGKIEVDTKKLAAAESIISVSIKPDGTATWLNPATMKATAFQLGIKDLKPKPKKAAEPTS